ncbi:MAG: SPASM domain-containing protein [Myxococcales bacterium]|nr:SPASM domain-containing protein [Myxococcales bacterium]
MSSSPTQPWQASRYNLTVDIDDDGGALYNGVTGACLDLPNEEFRRVTLFLNSKPLDFSVLGDGNHITALGGALLTGGFIVDSTLNELAALKESCLAVKDEGAFVLTISPTLACNLDCGYCFVSKNSGVMSQQTEREVIRFVDSYLQSNPVPSMSVDWFGGEPLLASRSIGRLSEAFMELCAQRSIPYRANVISNATLLTPELADQLKLWGVDSIQITIDGHEASHNERRPWKKSAGSLKVVGSGAADFREDKRSSFQRTIRGLKAVVGQFSIRLRINVDQRNQDECLSLLPIFDNLGWLSPDARVYPYLAPVSDFTDASTVKWSPDEACSTQSFYELQARWLDELNQRGVPVIGEALYGFPEPSASPCSAMSARGFVINEDGSLHKCGADSDTESLSVGKLGEQLSTSNIHFDFWSNYDYFADEQCQTCRALPLCLGGCARDRRDQREHLMSQNCEYRLVHEPNVLAQHIRLKRKNRKMG